MAVLTIANLAVTAMRFLAMRLWVFRRRPSTGTLAAPRPQW
jgi:hypothetical protein